MNRKRLSCDEGAAATSSMSRCALISINFDIIKTRSKMVNVGGRSKGCSTCRKRRVKCDETRPICRRCQRWNFACDGPQGTTFVESRIGNSRGVTKRIQSGVSDNAVHGIPVSASLEAFRVDFYICFTQMHLDRDGPMALALQDVPLNDIKTATPNRQIFHQAFLSFAVIFFGTQHRQPDIIIEGYTLFGVALRQLNLALTDPNFCIRDEIICSVATLALLECFVPTGRKNYLRHMIGLEGLFELRGPDSCNSKSSRIFKGMRHMILHASLSTRSPSILARKEWKAVMRENCSEEKEQEQDLFDILADCTVLNAASDNRAATSKQGPDLKGKCHQRNQVERKALNLLAQLHAWRRRWDSDTKNTHVEVSPAPAMLGHMSPALKAESSPFHVFFEFKNDSSANMLMLYNTTLLYVVQLLESLSPTGVRAHTHETEFLGEQEGYNKSDYSRAQRSAALEICRTMPYCLVRKSHVDLRIIQFAVVSAWVSLRGDESVEGRWLRGIQKTGNRELIATGLWPD